MTPSPPVVVALVDELEPVVVPPDVAAAVAAALELTAAVAALVLPMLVAVMVAALVTLAAPPTLALLVGESGVGSEEHPAMHALTRARQASGGRVSK